jgi:hypothetical protein
MILGMGLAFDTTIAGDRSLHCLRLVRLDMRGLAAQTVNLGRSGSSRFR